HRPTALLDDLATDANPRADRHRAVVAHLDPSRADPLVPEIGGAARGLVQHGEQDAAVAVTGIALMLRADAELGHHPLTLVPEFATERLWIVRPADEAVVVRWLREREIVLQWNGYHP